MRYHYEKPDIYLSLYGRVYICNHYLYDVCTLYEIDNKGLAVIQQRFDSKSKSTYWTEIDPWITDQIYTNQYFMDYFKETAKYCNNGTYPTVTIRQIMHALKMRPLKKEQWETVFDRRIL